ncbi:MAG TPA: MAC/perforin domain-containing protein, partial [Aquella sp.]|nr:MAC/perforin domain-containing protein [Aquella sp.]
MFILLFVITCAIDIRSIFEEAKHALTQDHCPFHDMHGLHALCKEKNSNQFKAKLGTGWDPIKAEIKLPFFKLTYDNKNSYTYNLTEHFVADQVNIKAIAHNPSEYNIRRDLYFTVDEYLSQTDPARSDIASGTLSIPLDIIPDLFRFFDTGRSHIISTIENVLLLDMKFKNVSDLEIHPFTLRAINSLPSTYDADVYSLFIEYWGTQIVIGGIAGGTLEQTVMTKNCFGGIDVGSQASLYLLKQFHPKEYSNVNIDARFQQYSRANIINVWGGNPALVSPADWTKRMLTLPDYPVLTHVNVVPITN